MWLSGGEELCVWNKDFQLQCQKQNLSDTGTMNKLKKPYSTVTIDCQGPFAYKLINVFSFWHFAGITALVELPKNCLAAAMDKDIGTKQILMMRIPVTINRL